MKFKFDININDDDFYKFNEFIILRSPYGKKSMMSLRLAIVVMLGLFSVMSFVMNGVTKGTLIALIPTAALILIMQLVLNPVMKSTLKKQLKTMSDSFSPKAAMEVYEDKIVYNDKDGEHNLRLGALERVSIIKGKYVYLHASSSKGYIIPMESFESGEQYAEFESLLKEKCKEINYYKK